MCFKYSIFSFPNEWISAMQIKYTPTYLETNVAVEHLPFTLLSNLY